VISAIVLAAGTSSRFGRPKQLLDLGGKPMLQHVLDAAIASPVDEVVVVLGHAAREIATAVPPHRGIRFALNADYEHGQSTSLRTGLREVDAEAEAVVVLLGDQPGIRSEAIAAVVEAWEASRSTVLQAAYGGRPAHPTLFARAVWPEVGGTHGDQGARGVLRRHPDWIRLVEVGGSPPDDIDTQEDYDRIKVSYESP
jgi:molybdenum cofactor cytidylyltransferase